MTTDIEKARREKQRKKSIAEDQRDMTVEEWCEKRRISKPTYYKLDRMGLGPEFYEAPGIRARRISPSADMAWEKRMIARGKTKEAKREVERRRQLGSRLGRIAVESPLHVSKAGKKAFSKTAPAEPAVKPVGRPRKLEVVKPVAPGVTR